MTDVIPTTVEWTPPDDPRTIDELMMTALCETDEDLAWDAISTLHRRGTREVVDRAVALCRSACAVERRVGADILGKLGLPDRTCLEERFRTLRDMAETEQDHRVLQAIVAALSHLKRPEVVAIACRYKSHEDPQVRYAVVHALIGQTDREAIATLVELSRDPEVHVRDWATFGLGSMIELDTPEIREALAARLADEDSDTGYEAMVGLARLGDRRILPALISERESGSVCVYAVEAAALIADPGLHPLLIELREWWDVAPDQLEEAIRACSPGPTEAT
ncbi:putative lyase [Aquisphaera giovannonii]|uniref:Putative lyase n=1 Tax=Aquisphaera giovannonii TaxID=406548 RepID=A0A5B9W2J3_9BACT|nr:HEAT repeat domain-containing protein [Aquisphaera giovannonii]QEH34509.1 putative lyase [Aquisphaera giovannonii]